MLIVSQDKKRTTESMELFIDMIIGNNEPVVYVIYADKSNSYLNLGIYKTEKRAQEVLQEIVEVFNDEEFFHIRKSSLNNLDELAEPKYILKPISRPKVYEMPED